jgi:flagellar L-ring protein precursor FlgH
MNETTQNKSTASVRFSRILLTSLLAGGLLAPGMLPPTAHAESLFRASTTYNAQEPLRPRSLFTPPIAHEVGDLITITISEDANLDTTSELKITRNQTINENGSSLFNNMLNFMFGKLPFNTSKVTNALQAPSFNGLDNNNQMDSKAETHRNTALTDSITCQVVQVLPNGDLVVQGQKTVQASKERSDLMVTGIVRPYYLDRNNQIASTKVGNFQIIQGGKGVISRQQNDGIANKIYQFFN